MKKSFITAIAAALFAFSFSAQAVEVSTQVGAQSKYVWRGVNQSGEAVSANAAVRATQGGMFGEVETDTLDNRSNLFTTATAGYTKSVAGVELTGGYNHYFLTGEGVRSTKQNFGEAFASASYKGVNALVAQTLDRQAGAGRNTYTRVGYTTPTFFGFTGDVGTAYTHYRNEGVTRHTNTEASVSYKLLKNVNVFAAYSDGGRDVRGNRTPSLTSVGVTAGF